MQSQTTRVASLMTTLCIVVCECEFSLWQILWRPLDVTGENRGQREVPLWGNAPLINVPPTGALCHDYSSCAADRRTERPDETNVFVTHDWHGQVTRKGVHLLICGSYHLYCSALLLLVSKYFRFQGVQKHLDALFSPFPRPTVLRMIFDDAFPVISAHWFKWTTWPWAAHTVRKLFESHSELQAGRSI